MYYYKPKEANSIIEGDLFEFINDNSYTSDILVDIK